MTVPTHSARITDPLAYTQPGGVIAEIPVGACLVEQLSADRVNIIWGADGQFSAELPVGDVQAAAKQGKLLLLD